MFCANGMKFKNVTIYFFLCSSVLKGCYKFSPETKVLKSMEPNFRSRIESQGFCAHLAQDTKFQYLTFSYICVFCREVGRIKTTLQALNFSNQNDVQVINFSQKIDVKVKRVAGLQS